MTDLLRNRHLTALTEQATRKAIGRRRFMEGAMAASLTVSAASALWSSRVEAAEPKKGGTFRVGMHDQVPLPHDRPSHDLPRTPGRLVRARGPTDPVRELMATWEDRPGREAEDTVMALAALLTGGVRASVTLGEISMASTPALEAP